MEDIKISQLHKDLIVRFSNKEIKLSDELQEKINAYWDSLIDSGKTYTRGEVFTVTKIEENNNAYEILMERTDYAHYLYCCNLDRELNGCGTRVVFTACLVETSDNKTIFGKMGKHTARAGIYQLAGGGIDDVDLKDGIFDLEKCMSRELLEELGVDICDNGRIDDFNVRYIKQGGISKSVAVIFFAKLNETSNEFLDKYKSFAQMIKQRNENPEFDDIVFLEKSKDKINQFFEKKRTNCAEYMESLFTYVYDQ